MKEWPAYKMARDLANGKVFPVSEAVILQTARKHGIGRKMGPRCHFQLRRLPPSLRGSSMPLRLVRRPKSPNWVIRGNSPQNPLEESTGTDDKKIAEEIRAKREAELLAEFGLWSAVFGVLSAEKSVESRTVYYGTAPRNVRAQAKRWLKRLQKAP